MVTALKVSSFKFFFPMQFMLLSSQLEYCKLSFSSKKKYILQNIREKTAQENLLYVKHKRDAVGNIIRHLFHHNKCKIYTHLSMLFVPFTFVSIHFINFSC